MGRLALALVPLAVGASACALAHSGGDGDERGVSPSEFPFGVLFDHPDGAFREVFLREVPFGCDRPQVSG